MRGFQVIAPILALACGLRLALFLAAVSQPEAFSQPDSKEYVALGRNFAEAYALGAGSARRDPPPAEGDSIGSFSYLVGGELSDLALLRTPGYPLLIHFVYATVGEKPWAVILVQVVLGVFTVWLTYVVGLEFFGPRAARLASLALAIDPISIIMTNYLMAEALFTCVLVAGFLCWSRALRQRSHGWSAEAGILLGASVLIRPVAMYLAVVLVPVGLVLCRDRWATRLALIGVFLLTFALPVGGWIIRNHRVTGVPIVSTVEGINLLYYRAAGAVAEDEGLSWSEARRRLRVTFEERIQAGMNRAELSRHARLLAFETLINHPVGAGVAAVKGAARLLTGPGKESLFRLLGAAEPYEIESGLHAFLVGLEILVLVIIMLGAALGCYRLLRSRRYFEVIAVVSVIFYFVAASAGLEAFSRFRAPIMPYFALLAACAGASDRVRRPGPAHGG